MISMIINGEKVPAFSATTLSIPDTPANNFEAIIASSRENYARPRLEVEREIRETIEQSEKYKKELSESGRQEPRMVINNGKEKPVFAPVNNTHRAEQKPNLNNRKAPTPQADMRRLGVSPNTAEGKQSLGLKDLAQMISKNGEGKVEFVSNNAKKGKRKVQKDKKSTKQQASTPVVPSKNSVNKPTNTSPVRPEVEYQEKSSVSIKPSHDSLPLSTPVRRTDEYVEKDNSVDGFLSIKH